MKIYILTSESTTFIRFVFVVTLFFSGFDGSLRRNDRWSNSAPLATFEPRLKKTDGSTLHPASMTGREDFGRAGNRRHSGTGRLLLLWLVYFFRPPRRRRRPWVPPHWFGKHTCRRVRDRRVDETRAVRTRQIDRRQYQHDGDGRFWWCGCRFEKHVPPRRFVRLK
jgi:hypothetical protein